MLTAPRSARISLQSTVISGIRVGISCVLLDDCRYNWSQRQTLRAAAPEDLALMMGNIALQVFLLVVLVVMLNELALSSAPALVLVEYLRVLGQ